MMTLGFLASRFDFSVYNGGYEHSLVVDLVVLDLAGIAGPCAAKPAITCRCRTVVASADLQRLPHASRALRARGTFVCNRSEGTESRGVRRHRACRQIRPDEPDLFRGCRRDEEWRRADCAGSQRFGCVAGARRDWPYLREHRDDEKRRGQ